MNRLHEEYQPEDWEVDPYDDRLDATERRAAHAAVNAELAAIAAAERYADRNIVDDATLQPDITIRRTGGGTKSRSRKKPKGMGGRPTLADEARSHRESVRMTPRVHGILQRTGENTSTLLEFAALAIESGNADVFLRLSATIGSGG